ncbi:alpha/beta fold hydrolase [Nocardia sp. NPDC001965]
MTSTGTVVRLRGAGVGLVAERFDPAAGKGRGTVLLLHGGGQTRHSRRRTGLHLAADGWCALTLDARGHGDSDWAADGDYSLAAHARDLVSVIADLGQSPVVVGASMGGMAGLLAQGAHPDLARALVLVDITPVAETDGVERVTTFMRDGLSGFDSLDAAAAAVAAYNPHRPRPPRPDGLRKNLRLRDGRWYWHWDPRVISHRDNGPDRAEAREQRARAAARRITVPTLLIQGRQSDVVGPEGVRDLLELIPHARLIGVDGAGHMVGGDDNAVLAEGLLAFLDESVSPPRPGPAARYDQPHDAR